MQLQPLALSEGVGAEAPGSGAEQEGTGRGHCHPTRDCGSDKHAFPLGLFLAA